MIGYALAFLFGGLTLLAIVVAVWVRECFRWWNES